MEEEFTNPLCSVCKNERPKIGGNRDFSYAELHTATEGFSDKNFFSEGGYGCVFKGQMNGTRIAVNQHNLASFQGEKEFKSEVNVLSRARHENVVMLLGSCSEGNHRLFVYEYVCNSSLEQRLSSHSHTLLSWEDRIKVATGAAKGLLYLHENNIIHRDAGPNNILITHDHHPLLGYFGLPRIENEDPVHSVELVGPPGYFAPEYVQFGEVSSKIDVYSFGLVLLQLITGLRATDKRLGGRGLVAWARPLLKERNYPDLIDERLINCHDFYQLFWMIRIAEKCLTRNPLKRSNMGTVVTALTHLVEGKKCDFRIIDSQYYSSLESGESEGEMLDSSVSENEREITRSLSTSTSSMSQMGQMIVKLPPSPPMECTSSSRSSTFKVFDE